MNNEQKNQLTLQVFTFLEVFVKLGQNDFVNIYLLYFYRVLDRRQPSKEVIKEIVKNYNYAKNVITEQQANHVYDETIVEYKIPQLLIFWETEKRRIDERHTFVKMYATTLWSKLDTHTFSQKSREVYKTVVVYFDELMDEFINSEKGESDYFQKHEAKLQYFLLQYLTMIQKEATYWKLWAEMNQMFRGVYEEVLSIPLKIDSSKIYLLHHFLRQSRGYGDELDQIQQLEESKLMPQLN